MTIAFIHSHRAFLPEISAYSAFFEQRGIRCVLLTPDHAQHTNADVYWHFMGWSGQKHPEALTIHEYASASTAPGRRVKNWMKSHVQARPDFRLFLNEYVRRQFSFSDQVPFGLRDMGIVPDHSTPAPAKNVDFIYIGETGPGRRLHHLLRCFTQGQLQDHSILVLGQQNARLESQFGGYRNIIFKGPVQQEQVSDEIRRARFAINFVPDREPFNRQTSTKLLEYCNAGVPVISTRYRWVDDFQQQYGGTFFYLREDLSNLNWAALHQFSFAFPDLSEWTWEKQIRKSGVMHWLAAQFPGLSSD